MAQVVKTYEELPTLARFHASDALVRGVRGPVGSGKSSAMTMEIARRARMQAPGPSGMRRTKCVVVRNTYGQLEDTTIPTFQHWIREPHLGRMYWSKPPKFVIRDRDVECEVLFRSLDRPKDVQKLLSLEVTFAWINEAREIDKALIDALIDRLGRFPPKDEGGPTWRGLWMDTNSMDTDHWWYEMAEKTPPEERPGWEFWSQPGGLIEIDGKYGPVFMPNSLAENVENIPVQDYYSSNAVGKPLEHIRCYYCNQYVFFFDGRPVFPEYKDALHRAEDLQPVPGVELRIGLDFGLTPAALVAQKLADGRWLWVDELTSDSMGIRQFGLQLKPWLLERYPGFTYRFPGDPAGEQRAQTDETTPFQILNSEEVGIPAYPASTNDWTIRREATAKALSRLIDGKPGLLVSPRCERAIKGLAGGYHFKRVQVAGVERYHETPDKNIYSHVVEAGGYAMVDGGEGRALVQRRSDDAPRQARADHSFSFQHARGRAVPPQRQEYASFGR